MNKSLLTLLPAVLIVTVAILLIVNEDAWNPEPQALQVKYEAPQPEPQESEELAPEEEPAPDPPMSVYRKKTPDPAPPPALTRVEDRPDGQTIQEWKDEMLRLCKQEIKKKKFESARFCFQMLLAHDPEHAEAHLGLGVVNASTGNRSEAYWNYLKYLELDPEGRRAREVAAILKTYEDYNMGTGPFAKPEPGPQEEQAGARPEEPAGDPLETLPNEEIMATMKKYIKTLRGCATAQAERDPSVNGILLLSFTIEGSGKVTKVEILSPEHKGTYAAGCMKFVFLKMKFPEFSGDPITVPRFPIRLGA